MLEPDSLVRPRRGEPRLQDHSRETLAALLAAECARPLATCAKTAQRALDLAFRAATVERPAAESADDDAWRSDVWLDRAGIGAWARPLLARHTARLGATVIERAPSVDGTVRLLLALHDGARVESVIIPAAKGRKRARRTVCISSQVGCARACSFCETGQLGLERQLTSGEIVDQYRAALRMCDALDDGPLDRRRRTGATARSSARATTAEAIGDAADDAAGDAIGEAIGDASGGSNGDVHDGARGLSNIVFMGMGEPMDNLREVLRAIELLSEPSAFAVPPSRITVSTVGVADKLEAFFAGTRAELAISLNAPDDARRRRIMPVTERFSLAELRAALVRALPPRRRVFFQYALFEGFNDALSDAELVADFVAGLPCRVNVIPANPGPDAALVTPTQARVDAFVGRLAARGVRVLVREARGRDVGGACGQLAGSRRDRPVASDHEERAACR